MTNTQASAAQVVDAGLVRITELAQQYVYLKQNHQPVDQVVQSIIDLRQKLEAVALTSDPAQLVVLLADVQETYGLAAVYTDPLLRPLLPPVPAQGGTIVRRVLGFHGRATAYPGNHLVGTGAVLVPAPTV